MGNDRVQGSVGLQASQVLQMWKSRGDAEGVTHLQDSFSWKQSKRTSCLQARGMSTAVAAVWPPARSELPQAQLA